ncbi:MAG: TolC family protein [Deltaproteobacteria bacterium]|nr:MAG: TolC family protein [Deltaproteobacteria bacterium]
MNAIKHGVGPLLAVFLGLSFSARAERRRVPLREALQLAARQGPDVVAARAQAAIAAASVRRAWTAWQPDLSANGTFDHTSAPASIPAGAIGNPAPITIVGENSTYATFQISQPLLTPQGLFAPGVAYAGAEAAERGADESREQVLLGVARAYLGLEGVEGLLDAARELEKVALRREQDARAQIAAGTAVEIALLRAQTETAQARAQIAGLQGQKASLLPLLEALVGEAVEPLPAGTAQDLGAPSEESTQPWEEAFSVKSAVASALAAQRQLRLSNFLWMPTVAGVAKENYNSNGGFANKNWTYDLILNVSVPLYDHGVRYAQQHEDDARLAQAQAQLASTRARARSNWIGARANLTAAQAVLEQSRSQAALAARTQSQVEASARAGVATSLDLSDADQKRFAAASAAAQAGTDLEVRKAEVAAAEGRLYKLAAQ